MPVSSPGGQSRRATKFHKEGLAQQGTATPKAAKRIHSGGKLDKHAGLGGNGVHCYTRSIVIVINSRVSLLAAISTSD